MNQTRENDDAGVNPDVNVKRSDLSYELIVRNNKTPREHGAPHLILKRQLKEDQKAESVDAPQHESSANSEEIQAPEIALAASVADYISSLHNHVPDDVIRVVDAIIEEEGKMPTNLPKLDDQLTKIYPGSDVEDTPNDDLFFERKEKEPAENKTSSYTKRVEYEDL